MGPAQARELECSGYGGKFLQAYDMTAMSERCGICRGASSAPPYTSKSIGCPDCGVKIERVPLLPSKAPCSKRLEDAVGQA